MTDKTQSSHRALLFDVFGTCVDWRSTVTNALAQACTDALRNPNDELAKDDRIHAEQMTIDKWGDFAQQWRNGYKKFTKECAADPSSAWQTVDEHHHESLIKLLNSWNLSTLWTSQQIQDLSLIWHRLNPWTDSSKGIKLLNTRFHTCTLSNGNTNLLKDLTQYADLPFTHLFSAEDFEAYKPSPKVYLGAAQKLAVSPEECVMVAAHMPDLKAARGCGFKTAYVERPFEEDWSKEQVEECREWVDYWINEQSEGFIALAKAMGIEE